MKILHILNDGPTDLSTQIIDVQKQDNDVKVVELSGPSAEELVDEIMSLKGTNLQMLYIDGIRYLPALRATLLLDKVESTDQALGAIRDGQRRCDAWKNLH